MVMVVEGLPCLLSSVPRGLLTGKEVCFLHLGGLEGSDQILVLTFLKLVVEEVEVLEALPLVVLGVVGPFDPGVVSNLHLAEVFVVHTLLPL